MGFSQEEWNNPQLLHHVWHGLMPDGTGGCAVGSSLPRRWQAGVGMAAPAARVDLREQGEAVSRKRVVRLMQHEGLMACPEPSQ